jgi:hypothetical protein
MKKYAVRFNYQIEIELLADSDYEAETTARGAPWMVDVLNLPSDMKVGDVTYLGVDSVEDMGVW